MARTLQSEMPIVADMHSERSKKKNEKKPIATREIRNGKYGVEPAGKMRRKSNRFGSTRRWRRRRAGRGGEREAKGEKEEEGKRMFLTEVATI